MFTRMLEEVVSVARPGSSDGGSAPHPTVMTCSAAGAPPEPSPVGAAFPPLSLPPQPAAASDGGREDRQ